MGIYAITGAATGIGAATAKQLKDDGHQVIVVDIKGADIVADLSTVDGRRAAVDGIKAAAPDGLDGFVPCAGLGPQVPDAALIASVNYFGALATTEGVLDLLEKKKGAIVMISSNSAPMGANAELVAAYTAGDEDKARELARSTSGQDAYGGSKLAITRWLRNNTVAIAARGIRINAVAPGITQTPLTDAGLNDPTYGPLMKDFAATVPVGFTATPDMIADGITFLLSDKAKFICGSVLFIDGGHDAMLRPNDF